MPKELSDKALEAKRATQREKRYAAQQRQMQRQREKQLAKLNDSTYIEAQKNKQRISAEKQRQKSIEKQLAKKSCPDAIAKQKEKQLLAQEKAKVAAKRSQIKQIEKQKELQKSVVHQGLSHSKPGKVQKKPQRTAVLKPKKAIKSQGLKGRSATVQERHLSNRLGALGCICCRNKGWYTEAMNNQEGQSFISMHHVEGRVKRWAHAKQLPLCHFHHQVEPPKDAPADLFPFHGNGKKHWEKVNGTQEALLKQVYDMISEPRPWLVEEELTASEFLEA